MQTHYTIRNGSGDSMRLIVTRARMIGPERYTDIDQRGIDGFVRTVSVQRSAEVLKFWRGLATIAPDTYTLTRDRF